MNLAFSSLHQMVARAWLLFSIVAVLSASAFAQPQFDWTRRNVTPGGQLLWGVVEGNAGIVAVGHNGRILHSFDGSTWQICNAGTSVWLVAVAYGNGKYVATGDMGTILTSVDGVNWSRVANSGTTARLNNVAYGQGKFVAVGEGGTIVISEDGNQWKQVTSGVAGWLHGLAFGADFWIATGQAGAVTTSIDGVTWAVKLPITTENLESVAMGAIDNWETTRSKWRTRFFVAVGSAGTVVEYQVSDGTGIQGAPFNHIWGGLMTDANIPKSVRLGSVASYRNRYVAIGDDGNVYTSFNAYGAWTKSEVEPGRMLNAAGFASGSLLVLGADEGIYQSDTIFASRLSNISTRGFAGSGANTMIAGTVVRGGTKSFLVRGIGPGLAQFGMNNVLPDPVLTVYDSSGSAVARYAGSENSPASPRPGAYAAETVGAFPLEKNSKDAAMIISLNEGNYTFMLSSESGKSGVALIEAYDLDQLTVGGSRAINISTRGFVGTGDEILIAGFVIQGPSAKTVLIRGVGPTMGSLFNLSGTLANPKISLRREDGTEIAANDDWGTATKYFGREITADYIRAASAATGAFPLSDNSKDAAMLVTLAPGNYTVHVTGVNNTTGIALVEAYEVPAE